MRIWFGSEWKNKNDRGIENEQNKTRLVSERNVCRARLLENFSAVVRSRGSAVPLHSTDRFSFFFLTEDKPMELHIASTPRPLYDGDRAQNQYYSHDTSRPHPGLKLLHGELNGSRFFCFCYGETIVDLPRRLLLLLQNSFDGPHDGRRSNRRMVCHWIDKGRSSLRFAGTSVIV